MHDIVLFVANHLASELDLGGQVARRMQASRETLVGGAGAGQTVKVADQMIVA